MINLNLIKPNFILKCEFMRCEFKGTHTQPK